MSSSQPAAVSGGAVFATSVSRRIASSGSGAVRVQASRAAQSGSAAAAARARHAAATSSSPGHRRRARVRSLPLIRQIVREGVAGREPRTRRYNTPVKLHVRLALPLIATALVVTLAGGLGSIALVSRVTRVAVAQQGRMFEGLAERTLAGAGQELAEVAVILATLDGPVAARLAAWKHVRVDAAAVLDARTGRPLE